MRKYFQVSSLLLYFLAILACFILGILYAGLIDAGKNQGLAGGAIVLGYGVIGSCIGLVASLFVIRYDRGKLVVTLNKILGIILGVVISYGIIRFVTRDKPDRDNTEIQQPKKPTAPARDAVPDQD